MTKKEEFEAAILFATDGTGRTPEEAKKWAVDYLRMGGDANQAAAADSANIQEAERLMLSAQREIDQQRCVALKQSLYFTDKQLAEISCKNDPGQLAKLQEMESQLSCQAAVFQYRMKNRTEFYSSEEAEQMARKELELPAGTSGFPDVNVKDGFKMRMAGKSGVPDVYGKSKEQLAEVARDIAPGHSGPIPDLFGKSKKQIAETVEKL